MNPLWLSISELALSEGACHHAAHDLNGRRSITADVALRLARFFAMTPEFWMNLQISYERDVAMRGTLHSHLPMP